MDAAVVPDLRRRRSASSCNACNRGDAVRTLTYVEGGGAVVAGVTADVLLTSYR
jgi:hypothetical protein